MFSKDSRSGIGAIFLDMMLGVAQGLVFNIALGLAEKEP